MKIVSEEITKQWVTIHDAAMFLGVSQDTLRRWEKKGALIPRRTAGGHRRYSRKQLERSLKQPMAQIDHQTIDKAKLVPQITSVEVPPITNITAQQYPSIANNKNHKQKISNIFKSNLLSLIIIALIVVLLVTSYILLQISKDLTQEPLSPVPGYKTIQLR